MNRQSDLFAISVGLFIASSAVIFTSEVFAQNTMKLEEPKKASFGLSYAQIEGISAPKVSFGYDINPFLGLETSYLQSVQQEQQKSYSATPQLSYRSLEAAILARPLAGYIDANKIDPYLKLGVGLDTTTIKTGESPKNGLQYSNLQETNNTTFVYGLGANVPLRSIHKHLSANADFSRHDYYKTGVKPLDVWSVGLKMKY